RVAKCSQRVRTVANGSAPGEGSTLAPSNRAASGGDQFPVVDEFQMSRDDFPGRALRVLRELIQSRSNFIASALELGALMTDASTRLDDCDLRRCQRDGAPNGETAARDDTAKATRHRWCGRPDLLVT